MTEPASDLLGSGPRASWIEPELTGRGRLPARATLYPFPDAELARRRDRDASPWFLSLNGSWRFTLAARPEAVPGAFHDRAFDDSDWADLPVPSNWTMHGHDRPHYTNVRMPFDTPPPAAPCTPPTFPRCAIG